MTDTRIMQERLERCLSGGWMRPLLQPLMAQVAGGEPVLTDVRVRDARRSASRRRNPVPLTLRYECEVRDRVSGRVRKLGLYAKVYRDGAGAAAQAGEHALHLPQLHMVLWPWPADPGLPQLPRLLDVQQTQRWWGFPAHAVSTLRYVPEQRATLRYIRGTGAAPWQQVYAKTFRDHTGEALLRRFQYFHDLSREDQHAPAVARPLGYCAGTRTFWQEAATGLPLAGLSIASMPRALPATLGRALAALHAAPAALAGDAPRDTGHWLSEIRRRRSKISRAVPALTDRVARVAESLEHGAERLPQQALGLIHGDCHPGQMWLDEERLVLFDFDEFTLGDPMEDVAALVTRLQAAGADAVFINALLGAYVQAAPARFCRERLDWHVKVQHLLQASRAFVFQVQNWRHEVERRLARAEALCFAASEARAA